MINYLKSALQVELNNFFKAIHCMDVSKEVITASAFCQARKKLKHQAFIELTQALISYFYSYFSTRQWNGLHVLAIDGSTLRLPNLSAIADYFGGRANDDSCPLARVSQLYDVRNKLILDAAISPYATGERELAIQHVASLQKHHLVLLDRGYASFWIFALLRSRNAHFCARMNIDLWAAVDQFQQSGESEMLYTLYPNAQASQKCRELNLPTAPLPVRLIRIELENGEVEILLTSLLDSTQYPSTCFGELYHERWGIEENYKTLKHRQQMENWTGKSVESIYQDFHARIFSYNLTAALVHPVQEEISQEKTTRLYDYQVNFSKALSSMKDSIILLFLRTTLSTLILDLKLLFRQNLEPIRPGRRYPRKPKIRNRQTYSFVLKQAF